MWCNSVLQMKTNLKSRSDFVLFRQQHHDLVRPERRRQRPSPDDDALRADHPRSNLQRNPGEDSGQGKLLPTVFRFLFSISQILDFERIRHSYSERNSFQEISGQYFDQKQFIPNWRNTYFTLICFLNLSRSLNIINWVHIQADYINQIITVAQPATSTVNTDSDHFGVYVKRLPLYLHLKFFSIILYQNLFDCGFFCRWRLEERWELSLPEELPSLLMSTSSWGSVWESI